MMTFSFRSRGSELSVWLCRSLGGADQRPGGCTFPGAYWFMPPVVWMAVPDLLRGHRLAKSIFFPPHSENSPNTPHGDSPLHEYLNCNTAISHFRFGFESSLLSSSPRRACTCVLMSVAVLLQCKLEQQACLTGKELALKCAGLCPCPTAATTFKESKRGKIDRTATKQ